MSHRALCQACCSFINTLKPHDTDSLLLWLCDVFLSWISYFSQISIPDGRFRGRPPWSAPSDRMRRTPQHPAGSSAPQRRSGPSSPWQRTDVWAPPTGLKTTTHNYQSNSLSKKLQLPQWIHEDFNPEMIRDAAWRWWVTTMMMVETDWVDVCKNVSFPIMLWVMQSLNILLPGVSRLAISCTWAPSSFFFSFSEHLFWDSGACEVLIHHFVHEAVLAVLRVIPHWLQSIHEWVKIDSTERSQNINLLPIAPQLLLLTSLKISVTSEPDTMLKTSG